MFFNNFVEYRNIALGDQNIFRVKDDTLFTVATIAEGIQGIRRQRLSGEQQISIKTKQHAVRIYEEMNRVLTGAVDFSDMISRVSKSFDRYILEEVYALWGAIAASDIGGTAYFPVAGAYNEDVLLDVIAHVEAASGGKQATIVGTKKAVRNLAPSITSTDANNEIYHTGIYGSFYGTPVIALPQRHQVGSTNFILDDKMMTVIATDTKPIKFVTEGDTIMFSKDPMENNDFTQELEYAAIAT